MLFTSVVVLTHSVGLFVLTRAAVTRELSDLMGTGAG